MALLTSCMKHCSVDIPMLACRLTQPQLDIGQTVGTAFHTRQDSFQEMSLSSCAILYQCVFDRQSHSACLVRNSNKQCGNNHTAGYRMGKIQLVLAARVAEKMVMKRSTANDDASARLACANSAQDGSLDKS